MDDFPSNSYTARIERKPRSERDSRRDDRDRDRDNRREPREIDKVITGKVSRRKKSLGARFMETFGTDDAGSTFEYILFEVVIPDVRAMIYEVVTQSVERKLGINSSSFSRTRSAIRRERDRGRDRFDYNGMSSRRDNRDRDRDRDDQRYLSRAARANHDFDEIEFRDSFDAKNVLRKLKESLAYYEIVTVADFYKMIDIPYDPPDENWGWAELDEARIVRLRNGRGYILDLPKPEHMDG